MYLTQKVLHALLTCGYFGSGMSMAFGKAWHSAGAVTAEQKCQQLGVKAKQAETMWFLQFNFDKKAADY